MSRKDSKLMSNNNVLSPRYSPMREPSYDYKIGDIVWAKIGKYPFWPSIVCVDPKYNIYMKGSPSSKKNFSLHVAFFNDNGRHCWSKCIELFYDKNKMLSKYPDCLSSIKYNNMEIAYWNLAVVEAGKYLNFTREERTIKFFRANQVILPVQSTSTKRETDRETNIYSDPKIFKAFVMVEDIFAGKKLNQKSIKLKSIVMQRKKKDKKLDSGSDSYNDDDDDVNYNQGFMENLNESHQKALKPHCPVSPQRIILMSQKSIVVCTILVLFLLVILGTIYIYENIL